MKVWIIEYYDNRWYKKGQKLKGKVVLEHTTLLREDATFFFSLADAQKVETPRLVRAYVEVHLSVMPTGMEIVG